MKMSAKPRNASRKTSRSAGDRRVGAAAAAEGCVLAASVIATPRGLRERRGVPHAIEDDTCAPASSILRCAPVPSLLRRAHVGAPAAVRRDLPLTFDQ